jgi:hypothetical protein
MQVSRRRSDKRRAFLKAPVHRHFALPVVVRTIGNDLHMDYSAVGQTTHLAARMEQLASPGSIRLSASTLRLVEGFVQVNDLVGKHDNRSAIENSLEDTLTRDVEIVAVNECEDGRHFQLASHGINDMSHDALDLKIRTSCNQQWLIVSVIRYEHKMPIAFTHALHRQFPIHYGDDDTVIRCLKSPVYDA